MATRWYGKVLVVLMFIALTGGPLVGSAAADDDFNRFGIRIRALGVFPDAGFDSRLSGLKLGVSDDLTPELDLEYFFLPNLSTELILGVSRHDITADGDRFGTTWLLPPTLTLKYHFMPKNKISPYLGAGINYVIPFKEKLNGVSDFRIDSSLGWALQAGLDLALGNSWYANVDLKYLDLETKMRIAGTKYDLDLNPLVVGLGVGYRF